MIFHIRGHIVRKAWQANQPVPETIQGTLCYMSANSDSDARAQVQTRYPDFNIETVELVTEEQILLILTKQTTLHH